MTRRVIYSRGFPYGAPFVIVRGGALKDQAVKDFIRGEGFRWNGSRHGYEHYMDRSDFGPILKTLRDEYGCEVIPKEGMDTNYILDLDHPNFSRPEVTQ